MRLYRLLCLAVFSCFSGFSYADLPYCENVFNGVLNTTGGKVELWGSSKVIGSVDLNSTTISGGGANCYNSDGGAVYSCTANGTLSQVVSYTVPALPSIPPAAGAANGTLDRSSGSPALIVDSSGNYSGMNLNGYGSLVSVTFDGRAAPIVVNIDGSVGLGGNVRVNVLGDVTVVANGYSSYGSPEVVVSQGASLVLKSRNDIGFSNGLKLNMQGSSSSVNVYTRKNFSLPNDAVMRGQVVAGGNIQLSGSASIVGPVSAAGNISMSSSSTIHGDVMLGGRLGISGNARIDGNLWAGSVHMSSDSKITGVAAVSGSFDGHDSSIFTGALVANSVTLTGSAQAILSEGLDYTDFCRDDAVVEFDHLRLFHTGGGQAVSCMATEIRVLACANEDCTEVFPGPASFPLGSSRGGFANHTVAIDESGQGRTFLSNPNGGLSTISSSVPLVCSFPGCSIDFKDSALFISNKANSLEAIPAQIAGKPFYAYLHAISTEPETKACEARVEGSQSVGFSFSCIEPGSCVDGQEYSIGGNSILGARELKFVSGVSEKLEMMYTDAGKVKVEATLSLPKEGDDPAVVLEGSAEFVSKPYGFCIEPLQKAPISESGIVDFNSPVRFKAGEPFLVSVTAVRWKENGEVYGSLVEPLAAENICGNRATPNYRQPNQTNFLETPELIRPAKPVGVEGTASGSFKHDPDDPVHPASNGSVNADVTLSEVGFFRITMGIPPAYLENTSMSHSISQSSPIGRIIPAWLEVSGVASLDSCDQFSYQRELVPYGVSPKLMITGKNRQGITTNNYDRGDFWRLPSTLPSTWWTLDGVRELTNDLEFPEQDIALLDEKDLDGQRAYEWTGDGLQYDSASSTPGTDDLPFSILQRFSAAVLTDADGACYRKDGGVTCLGYDLEIEDSEIRLGRLSIANGHGSELQPLSLPWVIESWQAPGVFLPEPKDSCSASNWGQAEASDQKGELAGKQLTISGGQTGHKGDLVIEKPEATGTARIGFPYVPEWLEYDWRGEGREASRGLATFGIYQGPKPLIFRREVYR